MKKIIALIISSTLIGLASLPAKAETDYTQKQPYMFKDPNWEQYNDGQTFGWPLPPVPGYSTGIYSMASENQVDYKEDESKFYQSAAKYKSSDSVEVYYKNNPSSSVKLVTPPGSKLGSSGGVGVLTLPVQKTAIAAYNSTQGKDQLIMDPAQGQWLVTNGYYSRNSLTTIAPVSSYNSDHTTSVINGGSLAESPWGVLGDSTVIETDDFLMGLSKALYGPIQSRPMYIQATPFRLARKISWVVSNPSNSDGTSGPIQSKYVLGDWEIQDVSYINPKFADASAPAPGETKTIERGEYIVHPDGYLDNVYQRYHEDQNSYVSANVYELYFTKLLQKGVLDVNSAFANKAPDSGFTPAAPDNFSFNEEFANRFYTEYSNYGALNDAGTGYQYPAWAPELGALYSNTELKNIPFGSNVTDSKITIMQSGAGPATLATYALGEHFLVKGDSNTGVTSINLNPNFQNYMEKDTVVTINALHLIERGLRIQDGDMSNSEASIIAKKYGAKYLDNLKDSDRATVSYLLAKGILNFENYQEYANLYSPLNASFAYELLYRIANKEARLGFSKITLTDSSDTLVGVSQYQNTVLKPQLDKLISSNSVSKSGSLVKDSYGHPLTLMSDVIFNNKDFALVGLGSQNSSNHSVDVRVVQASLDDPLKYLYRGKPLVNVDASGNPLYDSNTNTYAIYQDSTTGLSNTVDLSKKVYTGISEIRKDRGTGRWNISFYTYSTDHDSAIEYVKANLETKTAGLSSTTNQTDVYSNGKVMTTTKPSDLNPTVAITNDVSVNSSYDLTGFSSDKVSISGNSIIAGASSMSLGTQVLGSTDTLIKLSPTLASESIGQKELVDLTIPQLRKPPVPIYNNDGGLIGSTDVISDKIDNSVSQVLAGAKPLTKNVTAYSLSSFKNADTLLIDKKFIYSDMDKRTGKKISKSINGTIVIQWKLNLPSEAEQNSLVGNSVNAFTNDNTKSSWIFTKPRNSELLSLWEYNTGLNDAILKTYASSNLHIRSGYFSPSIDILVDSLNSASIKPDGKESDNDLLDWQLREIKSSVAREIGQNLDSSWVSTYIGNTYLANYTLPDPNKPGESQALPAAVQEMCNSQKSDSSGDTFNLQTPLINRKILNGDTVWSSLVFNTNVNRSEVPTYLQAHSGLSLLNLYTIYTTKNGNHFYGYFFTGGQQSSPPDLVLTYIKDNFGNLYRNTDYSGYYYDKNAAVFRELPSVFLPSQIGSTISFAGRKWQVVEDTPTAYKLISKDFIQGVYRDNQFYTQGTSTVPQQPILNGVASVSNSLFGAQQEGGVDSRQFFNNGSFDFIPNPGDIKPGSAFAAIQGGVLQAMVYKTNIDKTGKPYPKLEMAKLNNGDPVSVPVFVTISKNVWSVNNAKQLVWSKKFSGADPRLYVKGTLVENLKEQLLSSDSKNLVGAKDVKTGTLKIGQLTGSIADNEVSFLVPFSTEMISGASINKQAVVEQFNLDSDTPIIVDSLPYAGAEYLTEKSVGDYDPNYKDYHNTLVNVNGRLRIATGTTLTDYVVGSSVSSVSMRAKLESDVKMLKYSDQADYSIYSQQSIKPNITVAPFANSGAPIVSASGVSINGTANSFNALSGAVQIMDALLDYLNKIRIKSAWNFTLILILMAGMFMSISTLLAHVFAYSTVSATVFEKVLESSGIDFLAILSVGVVRVGEEVKWTKTVKVSAVLGIVPIVLFGVMRLLGMF